MSFEMMFLLGCLSLLGGFIVVLAVSTIIMGRRHLLWLQHLFSSLSYDKETDETIQRTLAKHEAGLLIARHEGNYIAFYTDEEMQERIKSRDHWTGTKDTYSIAIWIGHKFTQYGYLYKYHNKSKYDLEKKCGSYKTFRSILNLEDKLLGKDDEKPEKVKPSKKKEVVELE